jgi:GNAT superfamily N-acetyltransferase
MYEAIAERWVSDKCYLHCITLLAGDKEAIEAFSMMGFGINTIDAMRKSEPVSRNVPPDMRIESITAEHVRDIMPLSLGLEEHLEKSPSFIPHLEQRRSEYFTRFLSEKDKSIWVAYHGNAAASYMKCEPSSEAKACQVVRDSRVIGISGAYTKPEFRNTGIATAVLSRLLEESRKKGYTKCSVDFEPANRLAADFWLRFFTPVCFSMMRYVDERISLSEHKR